MFYNLAIVIRPERSQMAESVQLEKFNSVLVKTFSPARLRPAATPRMRLKPSPTPLWLLKLSMRRVDGPQLCLGDRGSRRPCADSNNTSFVLVAREHGSDIPRNFRIL